MASPRQSVRMFAYSGPYLENRWGDFFHITHSLGAVDVPFGGYDL